MSQMPPRQAALTQCPNCAEPLEQGDRFCGACGYDLSAVPPLPQQPPAPTASAPVAGTHDPCPGVNAPARQVNGPVPTGHAPAPPVYGAAPAAGSPAPPVNGTVPHPATAEGLPAAAAPAGPPPPGGAGQGGWAPTGDAGHAGPPPAGGAGQGGWAADGPVSHGPAAAQHPEPAGGDPGTSGGSGAPAAPDAPGAPGVPGGPVGSGGPGDSAAPGAGDGPGSPAAAGPHTAPPPAPGVRFDRRGDEPEEYPLQAPDPRVAGAAAPAEHGKLCVACRAGRVDDDGYCENCGHAQPRERDHMEQECGPVAAVSDRGLRHHRNEDAFAIGTTALPDGSPATVAIVCDGVSSATRPDDASLAASRAASAALLAALPQGTHPQQAMHEAIVAASHAVNALAEEPATAREHAPHQNAPACTLVGAVVTGGLLVVGWVGDSRAYWVPQDRTAPAARLTEDDSWAAQMVAAGLMSEAEAYADERAHAITGWLGADAYELEPHTASFKPDRPGVVVVCTDGLWNYAEAAEEMAGVIPGDAAVRPLHGARVLVGHALDGGGHDNVTVAVLPFPAPPQGAGSA
ncbi:magnesium or manganese-dependent protein phosphatase [Streptomyces glaucescens]|uniref:Magnesium or manganese-dependent protein phosphatase n=1 Tax=Streptomyces glaucescens TaxID=1907 RepID=A0A089X5M0_STRGA|nr:PP2C family serine/threonine-protein phosphatase [Streptomyces glaucescens]AIR98438.1 magnesium or manganese-dependent protein phosphatase [Streptomyces glaucescens]